jgi:hypothetical protein
LAAQPATKLYCTPSNRCHRAVLACLKTTSQQIQAMARKTPRTKGARRQKLVTRQRATHSGSPPPETEPLEEAVAPGPDVYVPVVTVPAGPLTLLTEPGGGAAGGVVEAGAGVVIGTTGCSRSGVSGSDATLAEAGALGASRPARQRQPSHCVSAFHGHGTESQPQVTAPTSIHMKSCTAAFPAMLTNLELARQLVGPPSLSCR